MKQFIKDFFRIGLMSCIGGPVILVIIYGVMGAKGVIETISYTEVVKGILTSALLAFIAGGSGTIYVIEKLPLFVTALIHGVVLYLDYILIYLHYLAKKIWRLLHRRIIFFGLAVFVGFYVRPAV